MRFHEERYINHIAYYISHPVEFIEDQVLKLTEEEIHENKLGRRLEPETKEILQAVAEEDYVTIHAGRGVTKSASFAFLTLWFCWTRHMAKIWITGPKFDQLKNTTWAEIIKWARVSTPVITKELEWTSERIYHIAEPNAWMGKIITAKEKENMSGLHGEHVLYLVDEASNVDSDLIENIIGGMTDLENKIVLAGNPTKASGFFFDSFTRDKENWRVLHFNSENSQRINPKWLERMKKYPRESDVYRVNVLGLPPLGNPKAVIPLADCEAARSRTVEKEDYLEMGLDPASEGNDLTAIAIRQGMKLLEIRTFAKTKAPEVITQTLLMLRQWRRKTGITSKVRIKTDDTGYGNAIRHYLALNEKDNIEVVPCLFGGKGTEEYSDNGTSMWFGMKDSIDFAELCNDDDLIEELSTREWGYIGGKIKVERKTDYKTRLGRSPDRADACIMCYWSGTKKIFVRDQDSESQVKEFDIDWDLIDVLNPNSQKIPMIETAHYAALVLNHDLSINGIAAIYEFIRNKLWIYEEFYQELPLPDMIAKIVKQKTKVKKYDDDREVKIIGDSLMFKDSENTYRQPFASILRREGLFLREPILYDEYGAIGLGTQMFIGNNVIFHTKCERARTQVNLWTIKNGKPESDDYGYCKALLLILSELRRQIKEKAVVHKMPDYKPVKEETKSTGGELSAWMRR